jgi:hypothetical protein
MDTTHGEPDWVNWSKETWVIEELMQDVASVGESINSDLGALYDDLPGTPESWAKFYGQLEEVEQFHHDLLVLIQRARFLGLTKG